MRCFRYGASWAVACSARTPVTTSMPAARSLAMPWPATCGSGSSMATTTRVDPGRDDGVGAGPGATGVGARLEGGGQRGAPGRGPGGVEGDDLGVAAAGRLGRPGVGPVRGHDDGADPGVGRGRGADVGGQVEGADHGRLVLPCPRRHPGLLSGTARGNAAHGPSLSSGLSPSALEFHQIGPHRRWGFADCHRRLGVAPDPARGRDDHRTPGWPSVNTVVPDSTSPDPFWPSISPL